MTRRETPLYIDVRVAGSGQVEDTISRRSQQTVKYVALSGTGSVLATKTYAQSTRQNSIDFINYVLGRASSHIRVIRTDWSLVFEGEFARHLTILNLRHERIAPYSANDVHL